MSVHSHGGARWCARLRIVLAIVVAGSHPVGANAQQDAMVNASPWYWNWSPLRPIGDIVMPAPMLAKAVAPGVPPPAIGLMWTASNPAALVTDMRAAWSHAAIVATGVGGGYRSPLAPPDASSVGAELAGWRQVGTSSAVIGRVATEREEVGAGGHAIFLDPAGGSPVIPAVSSAPATARTRVTLEGANAVDWRGWGFGLALAYDGVSDHAGVSTIALVRRGTTAGAAMGLTRALGSRIRVGATLRHHLHTETVNLFPNPRAVLVYPLDGFLGVAGESYAFGGGPFFRRLDGSSDAVGLGVVGTLANVKWVAYGNTDRSGEQQLNDLLTGAANALWRGSGWSAGSGAQFGRGTVVTTLRGEIASHRGSERATPSGPGHFASRVNTAGFVADVEWRPIRRDWWLAAAVSTGQTRYGAADGAARATVDVTAWDPAVTLTLARGADPWRWAVTYRTARYIPSAAIPPAATRGFAFQTLVAPALELAAAPAQTHMLSLDRALTLVGVRYLLRASWSTASATQRAQDAIALPGGSRTRWSVSVSFSPGGPRSEGAR